LLEKQLIETIGDAYRDVIVSILYCLVDMTLNEIFDDENIVTKVFK